MSQSEEMITTAALAQVLKSQYHAGLAMLQEAIERCPDQLWLDTRPVNAFWQIAYHALFFTHLYLGADFAAFRPWAGHQRNNQNDDGLARKPDPTSTLPLIPLPYSKNQVLEYWGICDGMVDSAVDDLDLCRHDSGFHSVSKLEHQLINIRHLQHHAAQLADRLRAGENVGITWINSR
jgi:hypothetical protein